MTRYQTAQQIARRVLIKGFENCQQLDPEHSSPRTGEQSRAHPPRAAPSQTGRKLFPSLDTEQREAEQREAEQREVQRREAERREAEQREADALAIRLQQEALVRRYEVEI